MISWNNINTTTLVFDTQKTKFTFNCCMHLPQQRYVFFVVLGSRMDHLSFNFVGQEGLHRVAQEEVVEMPKALNQPPLWQTIWLEWKVA